MPMGYAGYVKLSPLGTNMMILSNSAGLNVEWTPIYSEAPIGQGWQNAALNTHYAENAIIYRGTIDIEFQAYDNLLTWLKDWSYAYRAYGRSVDICPDGIYDFQYRNIYSGVDDGDDGSGETYWIYDDSKPTRGGVWCESFNVTGAEGAFVTMSGGGVALERTKVTNSNADYISNVSGKAGMAMPYPLNQVITHDGTDYKNMSPLPYWRTEAGLYVGIGSVGTVPRTVTDSDKVGGAETEAINWDFAIANNTVVLYTCRGAQGAAAILQGAIDVTGNITLYNDDGLDDSFLNYEAAETCFNVTVLNTEYIFQVPYCAIETSEYGLRGKSEVVSRTYALHGLGDGANPPNPPIFIQVAE